MTLNEYIEVLQSLAHTHGDCPVCITDDTQDRIVEVAWKPEVAPMQYHSLGCVDMFGVAVLLG